MKRLLLTMCLTLAFAAGLKAQGKISVPQLPDVPAAKLPPTTVYTDQPSVFTRPQTFQASSTVTTPVFTGTGLNDFTLSGTYLCGDTRNYVIQIDGTGTPDTFKVSIDNGVTFPVTGLPVDTSAILVQCGLSVRWAATTGHTLNDPWTWTSSATTPVIINNASGGSFLTATQSGVTINSLLSNPYIFFGASDPSQVQTPNTAGIRVGPPVTPISQYINSFDFYANDTGGFFSNDSSNGFVVGDNEDPSTWTVTFNRGGLTLGSKTASTPVSGQIGLIGKTSGGILGLVADDNTASSTIILPTLLGSAGQMLGVTSVAFGAESTEWGAAGGSFAVSTGATALTSFAGISNDFLGSYKAPRNLTAVSITGSAAALSVCTTNPTITFQECGTSTTCAAPTTIGTVTVSAANTITAGTISNANITSGDFVTAKITAVACASLTDLSATVVF